MTGAVWVAVDASIGNLLQGWDSATIAASILIIKKEFNLENEPYMEGLIVSMSLIGAAVVTAFSGAMSDWTGRRLMLIISSVFLFVSALLMFWTPNLYMLLLARLLDGFGVGLAVTFIPLYISEVAPAEMRGLLNTIPQFSGSVGMFLAYCMIFGMSLINEPSWRLLLGVASVPALAYFVLIVFFLPESPRWLVSKGKMLEARRVLQEIHGKEDISGEMALLVEGLNVGKEAFIEEYIIQPGDDFGNEMDPAEEREYIKFFGPDDTPLVARPACPQGSLSFIPRQGSIENRRSWLVDPVVTSFGRIHEKPADLGSMRSVLFATLGSMFNITASQPKADEYDEENAPPGDEEYESDNIASDYDDNLQSPLISRQTTSLDKDMGAPSLQHTLNTAMVGNGELVCSIGTGWLLTWKWHEEEDGNEKGVFRKIILHQVTIPRRGSLISVAGDDVAGQRDYVQAVALVSQAVLYSNKFSHVHFVGPAMLHPSQTATTKLSWGDLFEPGVKRALIVGMCIQILQQFSGVNGVLCHTPQILEKAGVRVLLSTVGISLESSSFLISALTTLLTLPCIAVTMRLADIAGRRKLLLTTIPILIVTLIITILGNTIRMDTRAHAIFSTVSLVLYLCTFVMGFGPIPNILCSEIFPTRIRGFCVAACAFTFWICNVIVTYVLPTLLTSIGLAGVFGLFAVICLVSWVFVFLRIPETKGIPLEVIPELFSVGAKSG